MIGDFHFLRPWWFLALPVLLWMVFQLNRRSTGIVSWKAVCDPHLLPFLLIGSDQIPQRIPWILLGAGWLLAVLALAGPTWSKQPQPVLQAHSGLVIVLDLSHSMDAQDVRPSRLTRAKHKVLDILKQREEGQTALVVFAQEAFVVSPLTDDAATIASMVPTLTTELMPLQGSRLDLALETANQLLSQSGFSGGDIIVISDGPTEGEPWEVVRRVQKLGRRISVLAVGTSEGAPVPLNSGGFLKDRTGAIVIPKADITSLQAIARAGGGQFVQLQNDDSDLNQLIALQVDHPAATVFDPSTGTTEQWKEEGPWFVIALIVLALPAFRRGWVSSVFLAMAFFPPPASAWTWEDLWLRSDQQGAKHLEAGNPEEAAQLFSDSNWKGVANYRAGDYAKAIESFSKDETVDSYYNRGNALARLGKLESALAAYEKVLNKDPGHEDAGFNANLIRKLLKQQATQQQSQPPTTAAQRSADQGGQKAPGTEKESVDGDQNQKQESSANQPRGDQKNGKSEGTAFPNKTQDLGALQRERSEDSEEASQIVEQSMEESTKSWSQMAQSPNLSQEEKETRQATAQWLRRIPDDPGGLLRRKFLLEHQRRQATVPQAEHPW